MNVEYKTAKQMAEKWDINERYLQKLCTLGRVEGAQKLAGYWMIPENAPKPARLRRSKKHPELIETAQEIQAEKYKHDIMPLMSAIFEPGKCTQYIESIKDTDEKNMAWAEYYYYIGNHKKCSDIAKKYIESDIFELRATAVWLYSMSNLSLDKLNNVKHVLKFVQDFYKQTDENSPKLERALAVCLHNTVLTYFHFKKPKNSEESQEHLRELPKGLRYFILYSQAYYAYNNNLFASAVAIAETCLAFEEVQYPIARIYLNLICAMCYIHMGYKPLSEKYMLKALKYAEADGFLMPFAELHMELCGMLEAVVKKHDPTVFRNIIALAKKYSQGWLEFHNEITGDNIPTYLTPTEYTIAMLAARDWSTKEIGSHLGITTNAANQTIYEILDKIGVSSRQELNKLFLP